MTYYDTRSYNTTMGVVIRPLLLPLVVRAIHDRCGGGEPDTLPQLLKQLGLFLPILSKLRVQKFLLTGPFDHEIHDNVTSALKSACSNPYKILLIDDADLRLNSPPCLLAE